MKKRYAKLDKDGLPQEWPCTFDPKSGRWVMGIAPIPPGTRSALDIYKDRDKNDI